MLTVLMLIFLVTSFDIGAAKDQLHPRSLIGHPDSAETRLRSLGDTSVRLPRRFQENSRTTRLHIENQTGFDGKVEKIHINSEEDLPRVHAYGLQKKNLTNNSYIERTLEKEIKEELNDASRVTRSVEAYGKLKDQLETNGQIERVHRPVSPRAPNEQGNRVSRSIDTASKHEPEDLEAQDAKVFRPLFVYRQQVAKRQHRMKNRFLQADQKRYHDRPPRF